jgi:hypothetical protein
MRGKCKRFGIEMKKKCRKKGKEKKRDKENFSWIRRKLSEGNMKRKKGRDCRWKGKPKYRDKNRLNSTGKIKKKLNNSVYQIFKERKN